MALRGKWRFVMKRCTCAFSSESHYRKQIGLANLLQKHGFPSSQIPSFLSRNQSLLHTPLPHLHHSLSALLSLRLPQNAFVSLLSSCPSLLLLHNLHSLLPEFQSRHPTISSSTLANLLLCSTKFHLHPSQLSRKLHALQNNFAFSDPTLAKVLQAFPNLLVTTDDEITAVLDFLSEFGIPRDEIDLIVRSFPMVLGLGLENRLRPLIREIKDLGFTNRELRNEISRDPRILGMEAGEFSRYLRLLESLKCREAIKERIMGSGLIRACFEVKLRVDCLCRYRLTRNDALKVLWKEPRVICYEIEDIEKKLEFVVQRIKCGVECVADVPKYLGMNYENQIVPRYSVVECLRGKGAIDFEVGLRDLVMPSRVRFYNLYVKPYPECEKIYGRLKGCGGEAKRKHPVGLWKLLKPNKFPQRSEDVKNIRSFMESLV